MALVWFAVGAAAGAVVLAALFAVGEVRWDREFRRGHGL